VYEQYGYQGVLVAALLSCTMSPKYTSNARALGLDRRA
jgi:hypothetical protein